jgi:hypothetical protein
VSLLLLAFISVDPFGSTVDFFFLMCTLNAGKLDFYSSDTSPRIPSLLNFEVTITICTTDS